MSSFQIIVGSMLGGTEYIAEAVEAVLTEADHQCELHFQPQFSEIEQNQQTWIICTSTHGAGDYPENIESFVEDLCAYDQSMSDLKFFVIAVGDSNYDTFCMAGKNIRNNMLEKSSKELIELFCIDMDDDIDPEAIAEQWIRDHLDQL
ncbi:flavodoxin domain-containing protein [Thalassotalea sp. PS06]|uniref:flavodoxin domain-containing protein n=1 Tax=Thalassotalea sp. PS06 TaxID=2594005 RepID=UPI0011653042|nr:flavodoxin domain-containing protein [Thalassotalea sp. PS06]QDP02834.1 mioC protein [Thalassotalea sp. PS06]